MTSEELAEDVKETIRRYDHDADDLRELSSKLDALADRYEQQDDVF